MALNFGVQKTLDWSKENAWKSLSLNSPGVGETPRDQSPTSAPEDPENVLPNQITAHSEGIFLRNVSPARALRLGNMVARGSVFGGADGALDLSLLDPEYLELLIKAQRYLTESGDGHSEHFLIGENKRKEDPHKRERQSSASEGSNYPPPLKRSVEDLPSVGMERDAPTCSADVHPRAHGPLGQGEAHGLPACGPPGQEVQLRNRNRNRVGSIDEDQVVGVAGFEHRDKRGASSIDELQGGQHPFFDEVQGDTPGQAANTGAACPGGAAVHHHHQQAELLRQTEAAEQLAPPIAYPSQDASWEGDQDWLV